MTVPHSHASTAQGSSTLLPTSISMAGGTHTVSGGGLLHIASATLLIDGAGALVTLPSGTSIPSPSISGLLTVASSSTYMGNLTSTCSYTSIASNGWTLVSSGTFTSNPGITISNLQIAQFDYWLKWTGKQNTAGGNWGLQFNSDSGANSLYVSRCDNAISANTESSPGGSSIVLDETNNLVSVGGIVHADFFFGQTQGNAQQIVGHFESGIDATVGTVSHCVGSGSYHGSATVSSVSLLDSAGSMTGIWKLWAAPR